MFLFEMGEKMRKFQQIKLQLTSLKNIFTKNMKLKQKFILLYLFGIFIPVVLVDLVIIYNINTYQKQEKKRELEYSVERVLNEFSGLIEQVTYFSRNIVNDSELHAFLERDYVSEEEYRYAYRKIESRSILNYSKFIKEISNITIYVENDTIVEKENIKKLNDITRKLWWYQKYEGNSSSVYIFEDITRNAGSGINPTAGVISLIREFETFDGRECILVLDLNYNQLYYNIIDEQSQSDIYICNSNRILFASDSEIFKGKESEIPVVDEIREDSIIVSQLVPSVGETWKIYALSAREPLLKTLLSSRQIVFLVLIVNLLAPTIIINVLVKSIISRLQVLENHFDGLKNEEFQRIPEDTANDEISQLFRHYNRTVDKIEALISTVVQRNNEKHALEVTKKQAELNALNTQVNPHFMYNTLECICMRSLIKGEKETADIVRCLSILLRQMSKWNRDVVTIEEELSFVERYLSIQKYRFAEKIAYEVRVQDDAKDFMIPKLTLVSFVENACVHGIEESVDSGDVSVSARVKDDHISIIVKDTGCGMDEVTLRQMKEKLEMADVDMLFRAKSTGVLNAYLRLKMYFGDRLNFNISSIIDEGTQIEICIEREFQNSRGM